MTCQVNEKAPIFVCSGVHAGIAAGMGLAGAAAAAILATSVTVAAVAVTAGLFAAPALTVGILMVTAYAFLPKDIANEKKIMFAIHAGAFALVSAAVIALAIALSI